MPPLQRIKKRNGDIVDFNRSKIYTAIRKAFDSVGNDNYELVETITDQVVIVLTNKFSGKGLPNVEEIQDVVEMLLVHSDLPQIAKNYILYRHEKQQQRNALTDLPTYKRERLEHEQ
jgi:ribonucleoside-triphosphate reductase